MNKNYLLNKNFEFERRVKEILKELSLITKSNCSSLLMFDTYRDFILFQESSATDDNSKYSKDLEFLTYRYFEDNEKEFREDSKISDFKKLDDNKIIERVKYHCAGDSIVVGYITLHFDDNNDPKVLEDFRSNEVTISKLIEEVKYLAELSFLKSENYARLYSLIDILHDIIQSKSSLTPIHMGNVSNWSLEMAKKMNLDDLTTINLYFASMLHDIGKLYISDEILNKKEPLTPAELEIVKEHSEKGYLVSRSVLLGIPTLLDVPYYIKHHHEKYDGTGYPSGLKGDEIPVLSQIIAICDSVDLMMSKHPYTDNKAKNEIKSELVRCSGTQFSPKLVDIMIDLFEEESSTIIKPYVFDNHMFIPNISVSFLYKDFRNLITFKGNFIVTESGGKIALHEDVNLSQYKLKDVYSMKMIFFDRNKLYEFSLTPRTITDNGIYIEKLTQLPDDKYFAVYWKLDIVINSVLKLKSFRVGASSLAFSIEKNEENKNETIELSKKVNSIVDLDILFELNELVESISLKAIIKSAYDIGGELIYYLSYLDLNDSVKDRIFRYLFKKQIESRNVTAIK